jgi:hypothetical protein
MNVFQSSICGCNFMQSRRYFIFFEFGPAPKMRRPAGANLRRKRTHDHFRVRQATQTDIREYFGCPECVAPLEMP